MIMGGGVAAVAESRPARRFGGSEPIGRRAALALLMAFMMINFADKAVLGLAAGPVMTEFGLSNTEFGLLSSAFYLLFSASAATVGLLGDRMPAGTLLTGLALTWSAAQLPCSSRPRAWAPCWCAGCCSAPVRGRASRWPRIPHSAGIRHGHAPCPPP
ncbi:hypothetical protein ACFQY4_21050 [Catellatospora bangladeshensis]|uniref:hypothetical protein n=1 Tax=Catellatospora bangladeshensis TaxID=310355 RepID=UPI00360871DD